MSRKPVFRKPAGQPTESVKPAPVPNQTIPPQIEVIPQEEEKPKRKSRRAGRTSMTALPVHTDHQVPKLKF